ncbi:hypothetical protein [Kineothrix sp. MB12-C1]|uniref:hypothetical protein n=1 Tax=Kineothrix sp. MB12-C1 TaxID=3070215 RepID=UPI0027D2491D|nr:hypothetical protein [Kineothrix sp. MB12-C1]WMC91693.1 hypothetical protein RBB56_12560 [Kineothrix sp. MB12-C1]
MNDKIRRISKINYKYEWLTTFSIGLLSFFVFTYIDNVSMTVWSLNILDCLWNGNILDFYNYTALNLHDVHHQYCGSMYLGFIPHAIWNIPIWIAHYFGGVEITKSVICMLWAKLYYVVILIILIRYSMKCIGENSSEKDKSLLALLISSSVYVLIAIGYAGQNDILWVTLGLISFHYYLNNDVKKFIIFAALSMLVKPYFLIPCIGLILLSEKCVIKIVVKSTLIVSATVVFQCIFFFIPGYRMSTSANNIQSSMLDNYLSDTLSISYGSISKIIFILLMIYIGCYIFNTTDQGKWKEYSIYYMLVINFIWLVFSYEHFYRIIMVLPYLYITIISRKKLFEINMWLDNIISGSFIAVYIGSASTFLTPRWSVKPSVIRDIDYENILSVFDLLNKIYSEHTLNSIFVLMRTVWIGAVTALLLFNSPKISEYMERNQCSNRYVSRGLIWIHILIFISFIMLCSFLAYRG